MPAQVSCRLPTTAWALVQILATVRTQSLAALTTQCPLWKFEDNIFADMGRQVHEVLAMQFLMKHELLHAQRLLELPQAPAAEKCDRRTGAARHQQRIALNLR